MRSQVHSYIFLVLALTVGALAVAVPRPAAAEQTACGEYNGNLCKTKCVKAGCGGCCEENYYYYSG